MQEFQTQFLNSILLKPGAAGGTFSSAAPTSHKVLTNKLRQPNILIAAIRVRSRCRRHITDGRWLHHRRLPTSHLSNRRLLGEAPAAPHHGQAVKGGALGVFSPILVYVSSERAHVALEPQRAHSGQDVFRRDGLSVLVVAALVGRAGYEADELGDAFLNALLCIVRDLGVGREDPAHDADHVGYRHVLVRVPLERLLLWVEGRGRRVGGAAAALSDYHVA